MGKFVDLTGQQFGEWTVLEYAGNNRWLCQCSCENKTQREVLGKTLRNGASKSCGHNTNKSKVNVGMQFNNWKVIGKSSIPGKWICECQCEDKTVSEVTSYDLTHNKSTNCGCIRKAKLANRNSEGRIKLEGQHIWEWDVIKYIGDKHYLCRCSCGKEKIVASGDIQKGISKSCGHNNGKHLIRDITNQRFGELTVKRYLGNKYWECECSCENHTIVKVLKGNLLNGSTQSCGCKQFNRISKEEFIKCINEYSEIHNELPFIKDLADILDRHEGHIRRYINEYELHKYINKTFDSKAERDLYRIFDGAILHNRTILNGQELDIYIPEKKLAIEFNGNYWHSTVYKDKNYHQQKTIDCAKQGIQLIHIFEYEWDKLETRNKLIRYLNRIYKNTSTIKIGAREVEIKAINSEIAKEFEDAWHIQGAVNSSINLGCYYNNELIGVITFGKPRFNTNYEYELHRLCWHPDFAVIGGSEKLFSYFLKNYNPTSIITYTDISKFTGNVYTKLGFKPIEPNPITEPNYVWINSYTDTVLTRYQTQKHKLIEQGLGTEEQTEDEIMNNLNYFKIYDSGNVRLEWKRGE